MPKAGKRTREDLKGYDSDGDSISPDDGPQKRSKPTQASKAHNDGESRDKSWELSSGRNPRRVTISSFKDVQLINIREYYEKDKQHLPGKKGISLTIEQYQALLQVIPEINVALLQMGIDVSGFVKKDEDVEDVLQKRKPSAKTAKHNIEETSDEDG